MIGHLTRSETILGWSSVCIEDFVIALNKIFSSCLIIECSGFMREPSEIFHMGKIVDL